MAGIDRATSGTVQSTTKIWANWAARNCRSCASTSACVFQDHKILFDLSVFDNVMPAAGHHRLPEPREGRQARVRAALDKVGLLDRKKSNPIRLSGGEQQRLCIARAVVHRPSILLADEPTGNLDRDYAHDIMGCSAQFNQVGVTIAGVRPR